MSSHTHPARVDDPYPVAPVDAPFDATVRPPGSKSLTNRLLLLAALADGTSTLRHALTTADDAQRMLAAIQLLGARVDVPDADTLRITGVSARWRVNEPVELFLNNAGTATRFLAAAAVLGGAPITIDGNARMRERPIGELAAVLPALGARVDDLPAAGKRPGCPPICITPPASMPLNPTVRLEDTLSSQFLSALLLIAPFLPEGLTLETGGRVTSASYVRMTLDLLEQLGARVQADDELETLRVTPPTPGAPGLRPFGVDVEPDASGATYPWTAAAIVPGARVAVPSLGSDSLQGDARYPGALAAMGAGVAPSAGGITITGPETLRPIEIDMRDMPDAVMSLAVAACFASMPDGSPARTVIRGVKTLRVKETDRIAALKTELAKIGVRVDDDLDGDPDALAITPPTGGVDTSSGAPRVEFDTYDDHRMAMSLALVGLRRPNVWIRDPMCVDKTYATFWQHLARLTSI